MKMEYQKIINLLENVPNQPFKFRTNLGVYSPNKQIRFKTEMLRSILCDFSDA